MARDKYVIELANTVISLFEDGNRDPSCDEIAKAHFPGKALGGEICEGIRKRLIKIRDLIEQDYDLPVYLLNGRYYRRFRDEPPRTSVEGRRCIPGGNGNPASGICLNVNGNDDFIWQAMLSQSMISGAGKLRKGLDRTLDAVEEHRLEDTRAAEIMEKARRFAEPEKRELAERVMQALPGGR